MLQTLRSPLVLLSVLLFVLYTGTEVIPGQWGFSLFTQERGLSEEMAGFWVSAYWGSFTIGRLFFGAILPRLSPTMLQRGCIVGLLVGAIIFWANPTPAIGVAGLMIMGFAQAPLFPLFVLNTPRILGAHRATYAIGFQLAGAGLGTALLPGLAGVLARSISLEVIAPFMVVTIVVMLVIAEVLLMVGPSAVPRQAAALVPD